MYSESLVHLIPLANSFSYYEPQNKIVYVMQIRTEQISTWDMSSSNIYIRLCRWQKDWNRFSFSFGGRLTPLVWCGQWKSYGPHIQMSIRKYGNVRIHSEMPNGPMENPFHWIIYDEWPWSIVPRDWLFIIWSFEEGISKGENVSKNGSIQQKQAIRRVLLWLILQSLITNNEQLYELGSQR